MPRVPRLPILLAAALIGLFVLAGCGDDEGSETPATTTATSGASGASGAAGDSTAEDAQAKSDARTAQASIETYATDHNGSYEGADPNTLDQIEPVTSEVGVTATRDSYEITADSNSGNTFTVERGSDGTTKSTCTEAGVGGCPENGEW
jgi:hypothetical protein